MKEHLSLFFIFLRLGLTSFGGPVAHLGYFRDEFVQKRTWLNDQKYADIIALCQFLPGPGSSQVGLSVGYLRKHYLGSFLAWLGFTLPSALLMILAAYGLTRYSELIPENILHGLKIVAVAVVAQAVWNMYRKLCRGTTKTGLMLVSAAAVLFSGSFLNMSLLQVLIIVAAGAFGLVFLPNGDVEANSKLETKRTSRKPLVFLFIFFALLVLLPILQRTTNDVYLSAFASFYKTGSLVFGGGHVVLPLLEAETVTTGLVDKETFLAGYGLAQAVPGPLFSFAAFLGGSIFSATTQSLWLGALLCLFAIYIPSFLLIFGILPYWQRVSANQNIRAAFAGINAAVVGLLLAALYDPIWTSAIFNWKDLALALAALFALMRLKWSAWIVVVVTALGAWVFL